MGKVTRNVSKKSNNAQQNQNKTKRKGRPPKKTKYVQQFDSSGEDSLSVRQASTASTRSRVTSIRRNEIPMCPEIHIAPTSIPSSNNSSNIQHSSQNGQVNKPQTLSAATSSKTTITMTSIITNNIDNSNTTTYVATEILPMNEMTNSSQPDNSAASNVSIVVPANS